MKRGSVLILFLFLVFMIFQLFFISAQVNSTEEQAKVNKAYSCLQNKTSGNCDSLSIEEKIFSVLAINSCSSELISASSNSGECWPVSSSSSCNVKSTAQAILALKKSSSSAEDWLYSKQITPSDLSWYLEIESDSATTCTISYGSSSYTISIGEDKKINNNAGSCLFPSQDDYWLEISQSCYNIEFTISCDQSFLTTTLFRKSTGSATIHVSEDTSSASAGGATKEQVDSYCFADSGTCNYEATLWATLALDSRGKSVSAFIPYLITLADDNNRYLPDAFLYALTGKTDYKVSLLSKQKSSQWWEESGDKYYDTALALYPLLSEIPISQEKINAKAWLLDSQDSNGCWENNIRNTGFILASAWPKTFTSTNGKVSIPSCEDSGFYCASSGAACTTSNGQVLSEYDCPGIGQKCCSIQPVIQTCPEQGGEICSSNEKCIGGIIQNTPDLRSSEICCLNGGYCSSSIINDTEENIIPQPFSSKGSTLWIWILLILIVLVVIGIIFRNKLRMFWFRIKPGKGKSGPRPFSGSTSPPHFPSPYIQRPIQRAERRILVPQHRPVQRHNSMAKMKTGAQKELDDILKKLKDMGK